MECSRTIHIPTTLLDMEPWHTYLPTFQRAEKKKVLQRTRDDAVLMC